jgi:hypothetical protein
MFIERLATQNIEKGYFIGLFIMLAVSIFPNAIKMLEMCSSFTT